MNWSSLFREASQRRSAGATFVVLTLLSLTSAASLGVMPLDELTSRADLIVYGRVNAIETEIEVRKSAEGNLRLLHARAHIVPDRVLKGSVEDVIIVTAIENMEDSPRFEVDQDLVLFLTKNDSGSDYSVIGLTQGRFTIADGVVVREQMLVGPFLDQVQAMVVEK